MRLIRALLVVLALLLTVQPSGATFSLVAHTSLDPSSNTGGTSGSINTTGANLIVVGVGAHRAYGNNTTLTDNKGNTYTALTAYLGGSDEAYSRIWYVLNPTVGSGHTFTLGGVCLCSMTVQAWSGAATSSVVDAQSGLAPQIDGATTIQAPSITPANAGSLFFTSFGPSWTAAGTYTINSSFTVTDQVISHNSHGGAGSAYLVSGSAQSPTWTISANAGSDLSVAMVVFKPGAGSPPSTKSMLLNHVIPLLPVNDNILPTNDNFYSPSRLLRSSIP